MLWNGKPFSVSFWFTVGTYTGAHHLQAAYLKLNLKYSKTMSSNIRRVWEGWLIAGICWNPLEPIWTRYGDVSILIFHVSECHQDYIGCKISAPKELQLQFRSVVKVLVTSALAVSSSKRDGRCGASAAVSFSSSPKGAAKRGVTPSWAVGRKKGALGNGFGGSLSLLRSFTKSRCKVARTLAGGTSDNVSKEVSKGVVDDWLRLGVMWSLSISSSDSSTWPSGGPGSSTLIGTCGSGRSKGADNEGSKRNLGKNLSSDWSPNIHPCPRK